MSGRDDWAVWAALLAVGLVWEFREVREGEGGWPLTRVIRLVFRTDTEAGRMLFVTCVDQGSGWLKRHILTEGNAESMRNDIPQHGT